MKKIKPMALAIVEIRCSEGIKQSVGRSVSQSVEIPLINLNDF